MLSLILPILLLQTGLPPVCGNTTTPGQMINCRGNANQRVGAFRVNGKIIVPKGMTIPFVEISLKTPTGAVVRNARSVANGAFYFDGIPFGDYFIEITDPRFELARNQLVLQQPEQMAQWILVRLEPNDPAQLPEVASLLKALKDVQADQAIPSTAVEEFRQGVEMVRSRNNRDGAAEAHFKQATVLSNDFYEAWYRLGLEQMHLRQIPDAGQSLDHAAKLKPNMPGPWSALGTLFATSGQFSYAIAAISKIDPAALTADDRYMLGVAYARLGDSKAAQEQLKQSIAVAPADNPGAYLEFAKVLIATGNPADALPQLDEYLRLFPESPNVEAVKAEAAKLRQSVPKRKDPY